MSLKRADQKGKGSITDSNLRLEKESYRYSNTKIAAKAIATYIIALFPSSQGLVGPLGWCRFSSFPNLVLVSYDVARRIYPPSLAPTPSHRLTLDDMSVTQCKAWTYTSGGYPSALRLSSITPPSKNDVKPKHILVKIHSAALNPVDIQIMNLPFWSIPLPMLTAEKTLCSDFAGTVIQGGEGSGFSEGDEVLGVAMKPFNPCGGTLSEIAHFDLSSTCVIKKKKEWTFNQAAGLPCVFLTARTSIERVAPYVESSSSKRVVILGGSSACGLYSVQIAKQRGWKVLSTCSDRNVDFVRNTLGADEVVDYTKQNVREAVKKFKPDAIIDNVGGTDCVGLSKRYITIVGDKTGRTTMGGPLTYYIS